MNGRRLLWVLLLLADVVYTLVADRPLDYAIGIGMAACGFAGLYLAVKHLNR